MIDMSCQREEFGGGGGKVIFVSRWRGGCLLPVGRRSASHPSQRCGRR